MDHSHLVEVDQPLSGTCQLKDPPSCYQGEERKVENKGPTSLSRSTSGCDRMYSLMLPFTIHNDTIANRVFNINTPSNGRMFGC